MRKLLVAFVLSTSLFGQALFRAQNVASGPAAITLVSHTFLQGLSDAGGTTPAIVTTGANFITVGLVCFCASDPVGGDLTDSKGNSYSVLTVSKDASALFVSVIFYVANPTVGSGHTFSFTTVGTYASFYADAFSGVKTSSPFDQQNHGNTVGTTVQPGSITPSENNELIVTVGQVNVNGGSTPTINSGYTVTDANAGINSQGVGGGFAYIVQTSAAATNPTWTLGGTAGSAAIASFKAP